MATLILHSKGGWQHRGKLPFESLENLSLLPFNGYDKGDNLFTKFIYFAKESRFLSERKVDKLQRRVRTKTAKESCAIAHSWAGGSIVKQKQVK